MAQNAPGKHYRQGITLTVLFDMFPDDATAEAWFAERRWNGSIRCPHCDHADVQTGCAHKTMPYRCRSKTCRKRFSTKTGTLMEASNIGYRLWAIAIYLVLTNLKGISSMKLHRDLGVTQKTAWFMLHRIREAWAGSHEQFVGPVEVDETYIGGKARNMHADKRAQLTGRGGVDKTPVVGIKDRKTGKVVARVVPNVDSGSLVPFVEAHTKPTATVYSDGHKAYRRLKRSHEYVEHSVGEYVRGMAHTNGIESHWSLLKRGYVGTYHHMSRKHLHRYVNEFTGRHNIRERGTVAQMETVAVGMVGKRVRYTDLVGEAEPVVLTLFDEPW